MWNPFSKKVEVEFIDTKTGKVFARSSMPPDSLPETFVLDTTLHLPGGDWRVVSAVPLTRQEFAKSGSLRLSLAKVESVSMLDPKSLLLSHSTIGNELPACDGDTVDGTELSMHEDDWRQAEWVDDAPVVDTELASIRAIHANHRVAQGFNKIHVRELIPEPLRAVRLTLTDVLAWAGRDPSTIRPICIGGAARRVRNGFAFRMDGGWIYGIAPKDPAAHVPVSILGFHADSGAPASASPLKSPHAAAVFVDWCRAVRTGS